MQAAGVAQEVEVEVEEARKCPRLVARGSARTFVRGRKGAFRGIQPWTPLRRRIVPMSLPGRPFQHISFGKDPF
tara:strand:- start:1117 stop:1338 length:222 start_codon:yes stop_codon:yes gene_type:complete